MSKSKLRGKTTTQIILDEVKYPILEEKEIEAIIKTLPPIVKVAGVSVSIDRDEEGRLAVTSRSESAPLVSRIAGSDAALPEVLRQLGLDIINRKLV